MRSRTVILLAAIPGLMFCIIPIDGISLRFCFQVCAIWLAGIVFMTMLRSWWMRAFFALALLQVMLMRPIILSYITLMMIAIYLAAAEGFSRIKPDRIFLAMCAAGILLSIWIVLQRLGILGTFSLGTLGAGPFNIDEGSVFLALCVPAFFRRRWWPVIPLLCLALFLCRATTGVVAALGAAAVYAALSNIRLRILAPAGAVIAAASLLFFTVADPAMTTINNPRWRVWKHIVWSYRSEMFGRGLGSFSNLFPLLISGDRSLGVTTDELSADKQRVLTNDTGWWIHGHNEYLQLGFEMGLQALALVIAYLGWIAAYIFRNRRRLTGLPVAGRRQTGKREKKKRRRK